MFAELQRSCLGTLMHWTSAIDSEWPLLWQYSGAYTRGVIACLDWGLVEKVDRGQTAETVASWKVSRCWFGEVDVRIR